MQTYFDWQHQWAFDNLESLLQQGGDPERIDSLIEYLGEQGEDLADEYGYEVLCRCGNPRLPELKVCGDCL